MIIENTLRLSERRNGSRKCGLYSCRIDEIQKEKFYHYYITFKCDACGKEEVIPYSNCFEQVSKINNMCTPCYKREIHKSVYGVPNGIAQGLRSCIEPWRKDSLKHNKSKCIISGENTSVVHHVKNYASIVAEAFKNLNIIPEYEMSDSDIKLLKKEILKLHYKYGYGVCLTKALHKDFHKKYGDTNNTEEQFNKWLNEKQMLGVN